MSILTNLRKRGLRDILSPHRWKLYFRGKKRAEEGTTLKIAADESLTVNNEELQSFIEQVIYRQSFPECRKCYELGQCTHCGCDRSLFYDKEMVDSGGNWQEMKSPEDWEEYKKDIGIQITSIQNG